MQVFLSLINVLFVINIFILLVSCALFSNAVRIYLFELPSRRYLLSMIVASATCMFAGFLELFTCLVVGLLIDMHVYMYMSIASLCLSGMSLILYCYEYVRYLPTRLRRERQSAR